MQYLTVSINNIDQYGLVEALLINMARQPEKQFRTLLQAFPVSFQKLHWNNYPKYVRPFSDEKEACYALSLRVISRLGMVSAYVLARLQYLSWKYKSTTLTIYYGDYHVPAFDVEMSPSARYQSVRASIGKLVKAGYLQTDKAPHRGLRILSVHIWDDDYSNHPVVPSEEMSPSPITPLQSNSEPVVVEPVLECEGKSEVQVTSKPNIIKKIRPLFNLNPTPLNSLRGWGMLIDDEKDAVESAYIEEGLVRARYVKNINSSRLCGECEQPLPSWFVTCPCCGNEASYYD